MQLHGLHHVTAVTGQAKQNLEFYTKVLGLRLVKKTVNQDDVKAYHLFYADKLGSPGTDMTFFDWPQTPQERRGTDSIVTTLFRVNGRAALTYWRERLAAHNVKHGEIEDFNGTGLLRFEDPEGQRLTLVDDKGAPIEGEPWDGADVPPDCAIRGFFGIMLSVPDISQLEPVLTRLLEFTAVGKFPSLDNPSDSLHVYTMDGGGPGKFVYVMEQPNEKRAQLGRGGTHHVAFRLKDDAEQQQWLKLFTQAGMPNSGVVDRFYFKSLYFRVTNGILFELATDGPGFAADEPLETMGQKLALPPFLEPRRKEIEAGLKPI